MLEVTKEFIEKLEDIPTLPAVATAILEVAYDPKSSADDVEKIIERDPDALPEGM